jgi:hypothetical protein
MPAINPITPSAKSFSTCSEARSLLRDAYSTINFAGTDSILAVHNLPHSGKPLIHAEPRIFEDRSGFGRELTARVTACALPSLALQRTCGN